MAFEYDISKHSADEFDRLVFFCSEQGECGLNDLPADGLKGLLGVLNKRGSEDWELVQLVFGKDGVVAFWKRRV